ncbi:MAG TPA: zinc-ribbon domain-containing protein [Candidatus Aminicenantes bacterium]|nr:zinc-ribbon domain-containing protein [Candidatus Aminicenantes bacterium]
MAITRCPYCHAIIDENDKYCNNCGTQLLFPEDDEVDEEIPGEKIIDAEVEEKDYTVDEPEDEKRPAAAADAEEDIDEALDAEMREEAAEKALDELVVEEKHEEEAEGPTEEVILVDEIEASEASEAEDRSRTGEIETGPVDKDETTGSLEEGGEEEEEGEPEEAEMKTEGLEGDEDESEGEAEVEYLTGPVAGAETEDIPAATAGESAFRPVTFDTKELEGLGRTVELSKEKIDKFIQVLAEKAPAVTPDSPPAPAPVLGPTPEAPREPTGSLPPWASTMKGAPFFPPDTTPVEPEKGPAAMPSTEEEVEIFPRRKPPDSTLGLPERLSQAPLPFEEEAEREEAGAGEDAETAEAPPMAAGETAAAPPARPSIFPAREPGHVEAAAAEEAEEPRERPPFSFAVFLKSKAFDLLFVGLFWLVALWLAAHAMGRTLFEVLGAVSGPMLLLYAVFVLLYVFLFKFFLGETLGDRLFRPRG